MPANFLQKSGVIGLFLVSFFEASVFPLPPEMLLLPMAVMNPSMAIFYAAVTTAGSTAGGVFGYFLGLRAGRRLLMRFVSGERISRVERLFARYGGWAVAVAGFTPIPYKVFTIASGVFRIRKQVFVTASLLSRGARFVLEAALIEALGEQAIAFIKTYFGPLTVALMLVALALAFLRGKRSPAVIARSLSRKVAAMGEFGIYLTAGISSAAMLVIFFASLLEDVYEQESFAFDRAVMSFTGSFVSPWLTGVFKFVTLFGTYGLQLALSVILLVVLYRRARWREGVMLVTAVNGAGLLNIILKNIIQRPRPDVPPLVTATGYSFPSGHAMLSMAFYGMLAYILLREVGGTGRKAAVLAGFAAFVLLIGVSRVYLGVHYPTDVLAGFAAGGAWLSGCVIGLEALRRNRG